MRYGGIEEVSQRERAEHNRREMSRKQSLAHAGSHACAEPCLLLGGSAMPYVPVLPAPPTLHSSCKEEVRESPVSFVFCFCFYV